MNKLRVLSAFGTKPEAVKMAPLLYTLEACPDIESICCLTAQHREMLDSVWMFSVCVQILTLTLWSMAKPLHTVFTKALNGWPKYRGSPGRIWCLSTGHKHHLAASLAAVYEKVRDWPCGGGTAHL